MQITPQTDIRFLKGIGEKRAQLYRKLGVNDIGGLLWHFPRDYIDLSHPHSIADAPFTEPCAVRATLVYKSREQRIRKGLSIFKLTARDDSGAALQITVFNSAYSVEKLRTDTEYIFWGRVGGSLTSREMTSPIIYPIDLPSGILPVYPQTAGLPSAIIRRNIASALELLGEITDPLPPDLLKEHRFPALGDALKDIHFPGSAAAAQAARSRFVFQELLLLSCALATLRGEREANRREPYTQIDFSPFYTALPFTPTGAQLRCVAEASADMCSGVSMSRLLQGDVGSGKTLVAAACIYFAAQNGQQSALMAPTEILAEQHFDTMRGMLNPFGIQVVLLTSATGTGERRSALEELRTGSAKLCVGTHALLSEKVDFHELGLVITDEQHRFGVAQRQKLLQKGRSAHMLVMSATPIPRTLSLIIYGDLHLSVLDEMPPGRKTVETLVIGSSKRARAMGFIRGHLDEGRQAYIVCPLIEAGEIDTELRSAVEYADTLRRGELRDYRVEVLHGKMKPRDKESVMRRFKLGEIQALVSTTVVEVGVDVPNAVVILIENAERFGLSQLHQLRGRVGRSEYQSWCILLSDSKGEAARSRLQMMKQTSDGFRLAEHDLQMRGPGDFFGNRQHGLPDLRVASLSDNLATLQCAQSAAAKLLEGDPALQRPEHGALREAVERMLSSVDDRPN